MIIFCKSDECNTKLGKVKQGQYFMLSGVPYIKTGMYYYDTKYNLYYRCMEIATIKQECHDCSFLSVAADELVIPIEVNMIEKESTELKGVRAQNLVSGDCFKDENSNLIMKFYYNTFPYFLNLHTGDVFEIAAQYVVKNIIDVNIKRK